MAMKHDRMLVFSAAFSALITMTILSAILGHAVPTLIPKRFTNFLASGLFLIFGTRMLREGLAMSKDEGVAAEMKEVEMELEEKEHQARQQGRRRSSISPYALEMGLGRKNRKSRSGSRLPSPPRSPSSSPDRSPSPPRSTLKGAFQGLNNLLSLLLSPAWVQTFVMTFLGEWGDRSQIATIAMAAGQDYWWVTGGAVSGHAVCTGVAVIGGRAIAGRVSLRVGTYYPPSFSQHQLTPHSHIRRRWSFSSLRFHLSSGSTVLRINQAYTLVFSRCNIHRKVPVSELPRQLFSLIGSRATDWVQYQQHCLLALCRTGVRLLAYGSDVDGHQWSHFGRGKCNQWFEKTK
jgi:putative Ca2+/H+ antiporter (TMEM165/GDT1 family)